MEVVPPQIEKTAMEQDHFEYTPSKQGAHHALVQEKHMSLWQAVKLYPKAVGWSMALSTALVMEGYDLLLLSNLYANPLFNRKFGTLGKDGVYTVTAPWQSGLSNGARCGEMLGLALNGLLSERFGLVAYIIEGERLTDLGIDIGK
jgi:SP family general alpha glucoside:H+ symporter-like MFS transporter